MFSFTKRDVWDVSVYHLFETDILGNNHERSLSGMTQFMTLLEFGRTNNYYRSVGSRGHLIAKHVHEFVKLPSPEEENLIAQEIEEETDMPRARLIIHLEIRLRRRVQAENPGKSTNLPTIMIAERLAERIAGVRP